MGSQVAEERLLSYLKLNSDIPNSEIWAREEAVDHAALADVIKSLHGFGFIEAQVSWFLSKVICTPTSSWKLISAHALAGYREKSMGVDCGGSRLCREWLSRMPSVRCRSQ